MGALRNKILVVDDDADLLAGLRRLLEGDGFSPDTAGSAEEAFPLVTRRRPDLILLDVALPGESGLDLCRRLREDGVRVPILLLTARNSESDVVLGLELGADDYLAKPFRGGELLARIRALLRRAAPADFPAGEHRIGAARVDFERMRVLRGGKTHVLTHHEAELLKLLIRRKGKVLGREEILAAVWGVTGIQSRTVDHFIMTLRRKIEPDPEAPRHIHTAHGVGYRLEA